MKNTFLVSVLAAIIFLVSQLTSFAAPPAIRSKSYPVEAKIVAVQGKAEMPTDAQKKVGHQAFNLYVEIVKLEAVANDPQPQYTQGQRVTVTAFIPEKDMTKTGNYLKANEVVKGQIYAQGSEKDAKHYFEISGKK